MAIERMVPAATVRKYRLQRLLPESFQKRELAVQAAFLQMAVAGIVQKTNKAIALKSG